MRLARASAGWVLYLALLAAARGETPPDPLRLIPVQADFLIEVEQPRRLLETLTNHPLVKQLQAIDAIRELYQSTNVRRLYQLLAHVEKQLGVDRMEMLDRLSGGGAVLGVKIEGPSPPFLLVVQSKDEQMLRRLVGLALDLVEQELARQESSERIERESYRGIEGVRVGENLHVTVLGSALVFSNQANALHQAVDLHLDNAQKSMRQVASVSEARAILGPDTLTWAWLNLESIRRLPGAKDTIELPGSQPILTVLFGTWLDQIRRAPFACAALSANDRDLALSIRTPRGRESLPAELATHVPPADQPGSRPLLEPKDVLFSTSYYLDIAKFWELRAKLFNEKLVRRFEEFDKSPPKFLSAFQFSNLAAQAGTYQRFVAAQQTKSGYTIAPGQAIPAFAFILEMREPEVFRKKAELALRTAALAATTQFKLQLVEEKHGDSVIVGYRFPKDGIFPQDAANIRFNFSPAFVAVGNQFILSSTIEFCHELVELLGKEAKESTLGCSPALVRTQIYGSGGASVLEAFRDQLFTQTILDQAIPPEKAKEQVRAFTDWVRHLGVVRFEENYGPRDFRYDIHWNWAQ